MKDICLLNKEQQVFSKTIDRTTYHVSVVFSETSKETIEDKVKRLVENDFSTSLSSNSP